MFYTPFLYEMNQIRIGIRTNVRPSATMTLCFRSPHVRQTTGSAARCSDCTLLITEKLCGNREENSGTRIRGSRRKTCITLDGGKLAYDGDQIKKPAQR